MIVRFGYDDFFDDGPMWKQVLIACSWREKTFYLSLPHAGLHTTYHLDVAVPESGLEITSAKTLAILGPKPAGPPKSSAPASDPPPDSRIKDRQAHLYHGHRERASHQMFLQLRLAVRRSGFIFGCMVAAIIIAGLNIAVFYDLHDVAQHLDASVVLLAAAPVVLGYVVVRPGEHALERAQVGGVRFIALLAGATTLVGAVGLILTHSAGQTTDITARDLSGLHSFWAGLVIVSLYLAVGLVLSWLSAASTREVGRDRRWSFLVALSGLTFAACVAIGNVIDSQPYSDLRPRNVAGYLLAHRSRVLVASAIVSVGVVALYAFLAGLATATVDRIRTGKMSCRGSVPGVL
jgi:hypothetical protein